MPPKIIAKDVSTKPVVSAKIIKKVIAPTQPKFKQLYHDHIAAHQKIVLNKNNESTVTVNTANAADTADTANVANTTDKTIPISFSDALSFYEKEFFKEVCVNKPYMDQQALKRYEINSHTGQPFDSFVRTYQFKYSKDNAIKIGEKTICTTKFLTNDKFCDSVIAYYKSIGYECNIYQIGYNNITKRYSKVCVKVFI